MAVRSKSWREVSRVMRRVRSLSAHVSRFAQARARLLLAFDREFYLRQYPDVAEARYWPTARPRSESLRRKKPRVGEAAAMEI
jgi:hypothetical protein